MPCSKSNGETKVQQQSRQSDKRINAHLPIFKYAFFNINNLCEIDETWNDTQIM